MTTSDIVGEHPEWDAYDDFTGAEPPRHLRDAALPVTLYDTLVPLDHDERYVPNHLDADGAVHFFAPVDVSHEADGDDLAYELRYFRAARTDDGRLVHDAYPVMPLNGRGDYPFPRPTFEILLEDGDLATAQELAHYTARSHGLTFPETESLPPLNTGVDYSFEVGVSGAGDPTLEAVKRWRDGAQDREARQSLAHYGMSDEAAVDQAELDDVRAVHGLEAAMNLAESLAVSSGALHDGRDDPRFFSDGPPDPFTSNAERERMAPALLRDITGDETAELPAVRPPEPGSWDELVAHQRDRVEPEADPHYWQMHYRPVETPDGEPLGTALFVTEFPQLPPDFDDYIEENGMDDSIYPTEARTVEMAHFATEDDARRFETEFRSYLVPGLLDGLELAPEVAKLEGLSGEWEEMDYRGIVDYMSGNRTIVREADDWHLHNPNAGREAREKFEGQDSKNAQQSGMVGPENDDFSDEYSGQMIEL